MLPTISKDKIIDLYKQLPEEVKDWLADPKRIDIEIEILRNFNLYDKEKYWYLETLISYHILGLIPPNQIEKELKTAFKLSKTTAERLNQQIQVLVLNKIRSHLNRIYNLTEPQKAQSQTPISEISSLQPEEKKTSLYLQEDPYREKIEEGEEEIF